MATGLLVSQYNFRPYKQKHYESRFTKLFEGYILPRRFGFDVRSVDLSSLVLSGQITRQDAISSLQEPSLTNEEVNREIDFVSQKLSISTSEFHSYIEQPIRSISSYNNLSSLMNFIEEKLGQLLDIRKGGAI